jgi:hypothetical protein
MASLGQSLKEAVLLKYEAQRARAKANLKVYYENPVGVGEHGDLVGEIEKAFKELDEANSMLDTIQNAGLGS